MQKMMSKKKLIEKRKNKKSLVVLCVYIYIYIYTEQQKKYHDPCLNSATLLNMRNGRKNRLPNNFISYLVFFFFFFLIFIPSTQQFHNISKLAYHLTRGPTIIYNFLNDRLI